MLRKLSVLRARQCHVEQNRTEQNRTDTAKTAPEALNEILPDQSPIRNHQQNPKAKTEAEIKTWFEQEFWPAWPLKRGKEEALKAALAMVKPEMREVVMAGLRSQVPEMVEKIRNGEPVKWAQGWINGKRWNDETAPALFSPDPRMIL